MINLKRIIALSLCTVMFINGTASSVEATIDNISSLSIGDTDSSNISEQTSGDQDNKNTITWSTSDSIKVGSPFDKMNGVKGYDKDGNDITNLITVSGEVDTSKAGEYLLEYSVTNDQGETIKATRKVIVEDTKTQDVVNQNVTTEDSKDENTAIGEVQSGEETEKNEEVKIVGATFTRSYLSEPFDAKANITATDSNGKDITDLITVEGEVDTNKLGSYELKYSVTDENGKTATLTRKVNVINKNIFNKYIEKVNEETTEKTKELGFSIYLDNNTSKFLVENQSNDELDSTRKDEVVFKIRVIDKDNKEKLLVELLGSDTGDSEKLNSLKELEYSFGDYIEINTENAKERFDIIGEMSGDIKSKVDAETKEDESIKIEDYSDGVDNIDYLSNVRFKITEEGIETVYNDAPIINGLEPMEELTTDRDKLLEGIEVTDDHDAVIPNDKIVITEEKDAENNVIALRYEVADSWGRSISVLRPVLEKPEEEEEEVKEQVAFYNLSNETLKDNVIEVHGSIYQDGDTKRFDIGFDINTKKIQISDRDNRLFDNKLKEKYFEFILYDKFGSLKEILTLNGDEKADSKKLDEFNGTSFEYGDQIHLYHYYSGSKLKILGTIDGASFGYNDGISPEHIKVNRFQINQEGLSYLTNTAPTIDGLDELRVSRGEKPDLLTGVTVEDDHDGVIPKSRINISTFDVNQLGSHDVTYTISDSWGATTSEVRKVIVVSDSDLANTSIDIKNHDGTQKVFSIKFDDYTRRISVVDRSEYNLNTTSANDTVFRIRIFNKAGLTKKDIKLTGNDNGQNTSLSELDGYIYNKGDTIQLWSSTPEKSIIITGNIHKDDAIIEEYHDGINDDKFMNNVRFELGENILKAIYNNPPTIEFKENLTIRRGEDFDPISFIKEVKDDNDSLNISLVKAEYKKEDISKVGTHVITYRVSDKWGSSTTVKKEIEVLPKNNLEKNKIKLLNKNEDGEKVAIATLYFDDIEKKLVKEVVEDALIEGQQNTNVFTIKIFNKNGTKITESNIKANQGLNSSSFEEITSINFEEGYSISIEAYNKDMVSIVGNIIENNISQSSSLNEVNDKYVNGFNTDDIMKNTRFTLTENGLSEKYNKAPIIKGAEDTTVIKNGEFNANAGITIEDDHDANRDIKQEEIIGKIDTSKVGIQYITYRVTDSWGRTSEKTREVYVKPLVEDNTIELKNSNNQLALKIGFDFKVMRFLVAETTNVALNPENSEKEFEITIYDSKGVQTKKIEIMGNDENYSSKLKELTEVYLRVDSQIKVWSKNSQNLSIKGNMIKDENIDEDYGDGIQAEDFMNNVVFIGTEDGLKAKYNNAPIINFPEGEVILYKGDNYKEGLLKDVTVNDGDGEDIDVNELKITLRKIESLPEETPDESPEGNLERTQEEDSNGTIEEVPEETPVEEGTVLRPEDIDKLGTYEATYSVSDSLGRVSEEKRTVVVKTSIDRNVINFRGYKGTTSTNGQEISIFKLGFNSKTMQIELRDRQDEKFNTHAGDGLYYHIQVYGADNILKEEASVNATDRGISEKLNELDNLDIVYGDYIKIHAAQTFRIQIDGAVRNGKEDYSDKVNQGDDFLNTKFYITESGLNAVYTPPVEMQEEETLFDFLGSGGRIPLRIIFNYENNSMRVTGDSKAQYDYKEPGAPGHNSVVLRLRWYRANGDLEREYTYTTNQAGPGNTIQLNNMNFTDGDYFTFNSYKNTSIRLEGNLENQLEENFSDGINNTDYMTNVRFVLRSNGNEKYMEAVYNEAPKFTGVEDVNIYVGDDFNPRDGVKVTDDKSTEPLQYEVQGNYEQSVIGEYPYTYTATDSWGRTTTVVRKVYVRPAIFKNRIMLYSKGETTNLGNSNLEEIKPAFEIRFDNHNGKYMVINQLDKEINPNVGESIAFKLSIYDNTGNHKETIELNGIDTGTSEKLERLNEVDYEEGDAIRVWSAEPKHLRITGPITGDVVAGTSADNSGNTPGNNSSSVPEDNMDSEPRNNSDSTTQDVQKDIAASTPSNQKIEDYNDGIDKDDYMKNVAFQANMSGLVSIYNEAPELRNLGEVKEVLFGDELNLKEGIEPYDDKGNVTLDNITITGDVNKDEVGIYPVTYRLTDTWGRTTSKEVDINVVSKIKTNEIHVYDSTNFEKFRITFNANTNKIEVIESENRQLNPSNSEQVFKIVVRNRDTNIKAQATVNVDTVDITNEFEKLKAITLSNDDTISIEHADKSKVKIKGNIENKGNDDFENSFPNYLEFNSVRFKVTNKGFELVKRELLSPEIISGLEIVRGDSEEVLEGIRLNFKNPGSNLGVKITIENFNALRLGQQNVTYRISDSWGSSIEVENVVTVVERNNLEKNKIKLLDSTNRQELLRFEFDTLENQLKPVRSSHNYSGDAEKLMELTLYDSEGITRGNIIITPRNIDNLESLEYKEDYLISLSVYDSRKGLSITNLDEYQNGTSDKDKIENVRFKVQESGLEAIYNKAPKLEVKGNLTLFKDESPDFLKDVSASDSDPHDKEVGTGDIQIESNVDVSRIGNYTATYTLYDTWGRTTSVDRNIIVKSSLENNKIQYYNDGAVNPAFDIYIDNVNNMLKVNKNYTSKNKSIFEIFNLNSSDVQVESDERIFEVGLFNEDAEVKRKLTILSTDNTASVDRKLEEFNNTSFNYGDYISVYAQNHNTDIKIKGNIDKPITIKEDYSDGIQDQNLMNNVRFKINEEALLAVYNEEPSMTIPEDIVEVYKGDDIAVYDGVKVSDDIDIDIRASQITISEQDREKLNTLGTHTIDLILTDSWERSIKRQRTFNVKTSIGRNEIIFSGYKGTSETQGKSVDVLKLNFNPDNMRLNLTVRSNEQFNTHAQGGIIHEVTIYNSNGTVKVEKIQMRAEDRGNNDKFNALNNVELEYGDYIVFGGQQVFRTKINGPVRNGAEDYTDGAQLGEYFINSKFYVREEGLVAEYTPPVEVSPDETVFEFVGSGGKIPLRIVFNYDSNTMRVSGGNTQYDYKSPSDQGYNDFVFTLNWHKTTGEVVTIKKRTNDLGPGEDINSSINNQRFSNGDYFTFETSLNNKIRISGNITYDEEDEMYKEDDFSNGIDNPDNLKQTKFYLKKGGKRTMEYVRIGSATIIGAEDIRIPQNSDFDKALNVKAVNADGTNFTGEITIIGTVNTNRIGLYEIIYEVTNADNITTRVYRNVSVYSESTLSLIDTDIPPLEQGSIGTDEVSINKYLLSLVRAEDPEDGVISNEIKVTSQNLDPEVPGTYQVSYSVTNSFGEVATLEDIEVEVIRTISVTVPTVIPFQVVTNLIDKNGDPFVAGMLKLQNNKTSDVQVSVKSFTKKADSGELEIIEPNSVNWDELSVEDTMKKMALGMFVQEGLNGSTYTGDTEANTLWFTDNMTTEALIGILPRAESLETPYEAKLSFKSKHGKNFIGGSATGKFDLVFKFE